MLDVCTGLGYTAIAAARTAEHVVTIELDPTVLEVARRNLEPRHVAMSPHAEHLALEYRERASRVTSSLIAAPEPPGRMQDIEVRLLNAPPKAISALSARISGSMRLNSGPSVCDPPRTDWFR